MVAERPWCIPRKCNASFLLSGVCGCTLRLRCAARFVLRIIAPISVHFNANTQGGSDIYRDGKLVGQITYNTEWREPIAKSYHTTFTHKGSGLYVGIIVRRPDNNNAPASIKVKTSVKLYRGNKYLKTYEKEVTLTSDPSQSLSSGLYKVEANDN